jgi:dTDP-4-dehydrorhamnose 3,5-epimerase
MEINDCPLPGLKIVQLKVLGDSRGFFTELFHADNFAKAGLPSVYKQDNHSRSVPGTLRGLHYQHTPAQGKLVGVINGKIWDVAVDVRKGSPTFGEYYAVELTGDNGKLLWIPPGFAHGFCVLGDEPANVLYKVDEFYNGDGEGGIRYNDPELNIPWPLSDPLVSDRDKALPGFREYCANPPQWGNT